MSWMSLLEERIGARFGRQATLLHASFPDFRPGRSLVFAFEKGARTPFLVIRLSRSETGARDLRREGRVRQATWHRLSETTRAAMPEAELWDVPGGIALAERFLAGRMLPIPFGPSWLERYAGRTLTWLASLREATTVSDEPGTGLVRQAEESLAAFEARARGGTTRAWLGRLRQDLPLLAALPPCAVHGDFWRGNLRLDHRQLRIFDWEFAQEAGNPFHDPWVNLATLVHELPGRDAPGWFDRFFLQEGAYARRIGRLVAPAPGWRQAAALTLPLAVMDLTLHAAANGRPLERTHHFPLLARLMQHPDPVEQISRALWPAA